MAQANSLRSFQKEINVTKFKKYIPILVILILMAIGYFSGFFRSLDFETLRYHHAELTEYVNNNPIMTPFMFIGAYIAVAALSIPGGLILSLLGGFLFRQPWCTLYVLVGATTGATLLFLAARTAIGDLLKRKARPFLAKMEKGFRRDAVNYMLFLRLIPFFPFWIVNLAPAFFNVRLRSFIWTTAVGILPGTILSTQAGRGLNSIFERNEEFSIQSFFTPEVRIALICLGIFALLPIFLKRIWKKK